MEKSFSLQASSMNGFNLREERFSDKPPCDHRWVLVPFVLIIKVCVNSHWWPSQTRKLMIGPEQASFGCNWVSRLYSVLLTGDMLNKSRTLPTRATWTSSISNATDFGHFPFVQHLWRGLLYTSLCFKWFTITKMLTVLNCCVGGRQQRESRTAVEACPPQPRPLKADPN